MSKRIEKIKTADGSETIINRDFDESYHSINGAVSESLYVFIEKGLNFLQKHEISVFEVGFGTGLNAFLTCMQAIDRGLDVYYTAIEKYPLDEYTAETLDFNFENQTERNIFDTIQEAEWGRDVQICDNFILKKIEADFTEWSGEKENFDLVFFDAFSYDTQPEMWSAKVFAEISKSMKKGGVLVTYSSKGIVKQNLRASGFDVKRLPGFKKRHMLRAIKI